MAPLTEMTPSQCPPRKRLLEESQSNSENDTDEHQRKRICGQPSPVPQSPFSGETLQIFQPQPIRPLPLGSLVDDHVKASFLHWLQDIPGIDPEPITPPRLCHSAPAEMPPKRILIKKGSMGPPPPKSASPNLPSPFNQPAYSQASSVFNFGSTGLPSHQTASNTTNASVKVSVDNQLYRSTTMNDCLIFYMNPHQATNIPAHANAALEDLKKDRGSPILTAVDVISNPQRDLFRYYYAESDVEQYFSNLLFPTSDPQIMRCDRLPMARKFVPPCQSGTGLSLTNPTPDMIYGYRENGAFTESQRVQLRVLCGNEPANSLNLLLPFFVVEFKGADGSLWVAENQCMGASATCINIAERLVQQLTAHSWGPIDQLDSFVFSVAMNGEFARLYISWKDGDQYHTTTVNTYVLLHPDQYIQFRKHILNILEWGRETRLKQIRNALDGILIAHQQRTAQTSKGRPRPE